MGDMYCDCGQKMRTKKEPCFFEDHCEGCSLCTKGFLNVVECTNVDCIIGRADLHLE